MREPDLVLRGDGDKLLWNLWLMDWHEIPTGVTTYVAKHFEGNGLGRTIAIVFSPVKEDSDEEEPVTVD